MKTFLHFFLLMLIFSLTSCHKIEDIFDDIKDDDKEGKYAESDDIKAVHYYISDEKGDTLTNLQSLVYERRKMNPLIAPDGRHHLTLEEFDAVKGEISLKCTTKGTQIDIEVEGLIPYDTYTMWIFVIDNDGIPPARSAGTDLTHSYFAASSTGKATYSGIVPGGKMTAFGSTTSCLLDEHEIHFAGAYHLDGHVYGDEPGPAGTWVERTGNQSIKV